MTNLYDTFFTLQRDPETGIEPTDLSLWMTTHCKNDEWSEEASRGIYVSKSQSLLLKHTLKYSASILI
jgi:hypothetical protein